MKTILFFLFSILLSTVNAQNIKEDMELLLKKYSNAMAVSLDISTKIYKDGDLVENGQSGHLKLAKGMYFYDYGQHKMLMNENWIIMFNSVDKMIVCEPFTEEKSKKMKAQQNGLNFDKLLDSYKNAQFKGIADGKKHYLLIDENAKFSQVDIFFDVQSGLMTEIRYLYNPKLMEGNISIVTQVSNVNLDANFQKEDFDEKQFVKINGKNLGAAAIYAGYSVYFNGQN